MAERKRSFYLVVDLEATCSDDHTVPTSEMETIEIGAVLCDRSSHAPMAEFQTLVKPVRHPQLTTFCTSLTGIDQSMVDNAPGFAEAFSQLLDFLPRDAKRLIFASWGDFDRIQFERDCAFHRVAYTLPKHLNLKTRFAKKQRLKKSVGMKRALQMCNFSLEGSHHRGLDDARNIARMLPFIVGSQRVTRPSDQSQREES